MTRIPLNQIKTDTREVAERLGRLGIKVQNQEKAEVRPPIFNSCA